MSYIDKDIDEDKIKLKLSDVIQIVAPANDELHDNTFIIDYIDENSMFLINVDTMNEVQINNDEQGFLSDETIEKILILDRSEETGYARQNSLTPGKWIEIFIDGDVRTIITGEITNLDEDMIEVTTVPDGDVIYIDFGYKGFPRDGVIERIDIRDKPLTLLVDESEEVSDKFALENEDIDAERATMEYTNDGESIISIPENAEPDKNIFDSLHNLYIGENEIVFGKRLEEIQQFVEIPESERTYSLAVQTKDILDTLLSTIPNSKRTPLVYNRIHNIIERFRQLREKFSKFDNNGEVYDFKTIDATFKPLVDKIMEINMKIKWLIPVVETYKKISDIPENGPDDVSLQRDFDDITLYKDAFEKYKKNENQGNENKYHFLNYRLLNAMNPLDTVEEKDTHLVTETEVTDEIEGIVNNLDNFYSSVYFANSTTRQRYVIQKYGLGMKKFEENVLKSGKIIYTQGKLTPNDKITIKSFIMMPEPVMRYSKIKLPGTDILEKSNLHNYYFQLFRMFKDKTEISQHVVTDLESELDYETYETEYNIPFLSEMKEYILSPDLEKEHDKFFKFLNVIIPKTRTVIRLVRKYLTDKLSLYEFVKNLEPFMIYTSDITYKQYMEIRYHIKEKMLEFQKNFIKRSKEMGSWRQKCYDIERQNASSRKDYFVKQEIFNTNKELLSLFANAYKITEDIRNKSSEIINQLYNDDQAKYFTTLLSIFMISLVTPANLLDAIKKSKIDDLSDIEKIKPKDCVRRYLTKKYTSLKDLQKDNNTEDVFYDTEFDDTPYSILNGYKKEQKEMIKEVFIEFLAENLIQKHDCPKNISREMAITIIDKKKRVSEGEYAILEIMPQLPTEIDESTLSEKEKKDINIEANARKIVMYYKRVKNNWVVDNSINDEAFIDTNEIFCNLKNSCYKNSKNNVCESSDISEIRIHKNQVSRIQKEFDERYTMSLENMTKELQKELEINLKNVVRFKKITETRLYKSNNYSTALAKLANKEDILISPHVKLLDLILSQEDFVKKQQDILTFADAYCRKPMEDLKEEVGWLYCKDTNTKLLPEFLYELAYTFMSGGDYINKLNELCRTIGSDEGDAIVDKRSGYIIRKIDFSSEEGYTDEGFKITTNSIVEKDLGTTLSEIISDKKKQTARVYENELESNIYNVFRAITSNIDLPKETFEEFVMRTSVEIIEKHVLKKEEYEKRALKLEKTKGKASLPYDIYKNRATISITASVLLVAIQTVIPSIKSRKTFPGCVRSFSGYPLSGGVEDMSGLNYIACIVSKIKSSITPWNSIEKVKATEIPKLLKESIDKYIIADRPDITDLFVKKREYMLLHPDEILPDEHSITKWFSFLPPVVSFSVVKTLRNVTNDFKKEMLDLMNKGSKDQREHFAIFKSKIARFTYGIVEAINKIVKEKDLALKNSARIPFTENACCSENNIVNPITYFKSENTEIEGYINIINDLNYFVRYIDSFAKPSIYFNNTSSINRFPKLTNDLHGEHIIYETIFYYCNFDNELPIPTDLLEICKEKPEEYSSKWSIIEKVDFMKSIGKRYTINDLHKVMRIIHNRDISEISHYNVYSQVDSLRDLLDSFDINDTTIIEKPLRKHLRDVLNTYNPTVMNNRDSNEHTKLKNYLRTANEMMFKTIISFIDKFGNLKDSEFDRVQQFILNIDKWNSQDNELHIITQFIKNSIYEMTRLYPTCIINNKGTYNDVPKHWNLSEQHMNDLQLIINNYWEKFHKFTTHDKSLSLSRVALEIQNKLKDVYLLICNIPVQNPIKRENGEFYSLFDKSTVHLIFIYCWYSVFYEYIQLANDPDILQANIQEIKDARRQEINDLNDTALQIHAMEITSDDQKEENELKEVDIDLGNQIDLQKEVALLLISFLSIDSINKKTIDMTYDQIIKGTRGSKDIEKSKMTSYLGNMDKEERKIEDMFKKYRMEKWNVGQQKGLISYDKKFYDAERNDVIDYDNSVFAMKEPILGEESRTLDDIERDEVAEMDAEIEKEMYDISDLAENYDDGAYYEEDHDTDDF